VGPIGPIGPMGPPGSVCHNCVSVDGDEMRVTQSAGLSRQYFM
jgi:hypothetical protein